ncbi:TonB-dependent siderophore receptor [Mesonia sp. K7]|uniref:TonB-dependent receptor plug domain-containing protein n=1 Tax=Mesonia sp. K7 TaxID=2218606 RepID=UPI000DAA3AE3|nr:TonB-dependent receptor plug domain-containing protein [Mesonia sp. K7]PZD77578.1 TonB-dependent receptor [Mesonia sp. K7]
MPKNYKLLFLFCCFFTLFSAKTLAQKATDSIALPQALQQLEEKFGYYFTYADADVNDIKIIGFDISKPFNASINLIERQTSLEFRFIGERNIAITSNREQKTEIPVEKLNEIVITNYLARGISKKDRGVFEINYKNFGILPGLIEPDALQSLQALPGVESVNEKISDLNIRGGSSDQNMLIWDGIRMYQYGHFLGLISAINPYLTKNTMLIKNGTNPTYGNSVSSVILLNTEDEINQGFSAETGVNYLSIYGLADVPVSKNFSVITAARTSINSVFVTPTYNQYFDRAFQNTDITNVNEDIIQRNEDFSFYDLSLRGLFQASAKDKLRFNFMYLSNQLDFSENQILADTLTSKRSNLEQNNLGLGLNYRRNWSDKFSTNAQVYYSNYKLNAQNFDENTITELTQNNEVAETSFKLQTNYQLNDKIQLENGAELLQTEIINQQENDNNLSESEEKMFSPAFFSNIHFKSLDKRTYANFGLRFNYFDVQEKFLVEPRFSFNQVLTDEISFEFLGETKSQYISQYIDFQKDFLGVENQRWVLSNNLDRPIQESLQLSIGINYKRKNWLASLEAYTKKVNNVNTQSQGFQDQYELVSLVGETFIRGIDFIINRRFKKFQTSINYSLTNNDYQFDAISEEPIPSNLEIVNSLSVIASYDYNDLKLATGLKWRSGRHYTPISQEGLANNQFDYLSPNSEDLNPYLRLDFSASKAFEIHENIKAYAGISVWNLLNRKNTVNAYYEQIDNEIVFIEQEGLGITPNLVFRLIF